MASLSVRELRRRHATIGVGAARLRIGLRDAPIALPAVAHVHGRRALIIDIGLGQLIVLTVLVQGLGRQLG